MARMVFKEAGGIRFVGTSLAGEETVVAAPEYNVCFDVGRAPREIISIDTVCLSHGHMDHAAGIAYYFSQRTFVGNAPGRVVVHRGLAQAIQQLMAVWSDIEGHPSPGQVLGVESLEDVSIRRGLVVRPFAVNHGAFALGYSLVEQRHKLKEEFLGKSGPELVALKKQGVQIEHHVEVPLLTYTGDTALGRWLEFDFVRSSGVLLAECTFFERDHVSRARAGKHVHVVDLPALCEAVPGAQIVLTHLTRRTDLREAKRILQRVLKPSDLERVSFFMERPPRADGGRRPLSHSRRTTSTAAAPEVRVEQ
jgi:ribonuclease Z